MCEGVWVCRVCDMCLCGVVSFPCLPTVRSLVPYKTRGGRPGQLSQRKISISTLVDKEGKGLNKLEAMSVQVVDREGEGSEQGSHNMEDLLLIAQDKRDANEIIPLVGDPTHPLSTLTFSYYKHQELDSWEGLGTRLV